METFDALLEGDERFVVPQPITPLCTGRVLTMTWEEGLPLSTWLRQSPSYEDRETLGRALLDLYFREFFEWGVVQTDPNPGNFLLRPRRQQVVLLDFGAAVAYEPRFRQRYVELLQAVRQGHRERVVELGIAFELLDSRESRAARAAFADMLESAVVPFKPSRQPFQFGDAGYAAEQRDVVRRFTSNLRFSPPPKRLIFLHRKLGGLFQLLKKLDLRLDLAPYWQRMAVESVG